MYYNTMFILEDINFARLHTNTNEYILFIYFLCMQCKYNNFLILIFIIYAYLLGGYA